MLRGNLFLIIVVGFIYYPLEASLLIEEQELNQEMYNKHKAQFKKDKNLQELMQHLTLVKSINLQKNDCTGEDLQIVARVLSRTTKLERLNLNYNDLGEYNEQSAWYAFGDKLGKNRSLKVLSLVGCKIGEYVSAKISWALRSGCCLTSLNLTDNNIRDSGAKVLAQALIEAPKTLTTLSLSKNSIRDTGIISIAKALAKNQSLTSLDLSENQAGYEGIIALGENISDNNTLTSLSLRNNQIPLEGLRAIALGIAYHDGKFDLDLSNNKFVPEVIEDTSKYKKILLKNKKPVSITLNKSIIINNALKTLRPGVEESEQAKEPSMTPHIGTILNFLEDNVLKKKRLSKINLHGYILEEESIINLMKIIKKYSQIITLDLSNTEMKDEHALTLSEYLSTPHLHLIYINLSNNKITDDGAYCLRDAFQNNQNLMEINLEGNLLTKYCLHDIKKIIDERKQLKRKQLQDLIIREAPLKEVLSTLQVNKKILKERVKELQKDNMLKKEKSSFIETNWL